VDVPSSVCRCCCCREAFRFRYTDLLTSPPRRYWRRYRAQGPPRTCWSDSCRCRSGQYSNNLQGMGYSLFQRVRNQHQHLLVLIQQQHNTQISQPLIAEPRTSHQLQTFDLAEMRGISKHVDVEQLCDVVMPRERVFLLEGCSDRCGFLLNERSLIGQCLIYVEALVSRTVEIMRSHTLHDLMALIRAIRGTISPSFPILEVYSPFKL
jgi:hypothetical protein